MSNEWLDIVEKVVFFIFIIFIVFLFADTTLRLIWNKIYFTIGVPIFSMRIPVKMPHTNIPSQSLFQAQFQTRWIRSLTFKEIDYCTLGFREIFFETPWIDIDHFPFRKHTSYLSLMHGLLMFDNENQEVVVKGIANWAALWFTFWFTVVSSTIMILFPIEESITIIPVIFIIALGLGFNYAAQRTRFSKVAIFASQAWSRHYAINDNAG